MAETFRAELPVAGRPVTVVGGRETASGYVATLRDAGADVTVVAEDAVATIADLAERGLVTWHRRPYSPGDLDAPWLVVAATENVERDAAIASDAEAERLWCLGPTITEPRAADRPRSAPSPRDPASGATGGEVALVGGGPGDPGLLTVAGREALRRADLVVTDRLAPHASLAEVPDGAEVIDVGKIPRGSSTSQEEINRLLVDNAARGRRVVRFKGGDSFLFGRGGEELRACADAGVDVRVIPGVSSALAVPAAAGIPVTHRGLNQGFTVLSGHVRPGDPRSTVDYAALARSGTDLVLLMAVATLPDITEALLDAGLSPDTPAATITDGTLPSQRVIRGTAATIAADAAAAAVVAPAVTVIGAVAGFDSFRTAQDAAR